MTCTIQMLEPFRFSLSHIFPCPRASVVSCKVFYHSGFWIGSIPPLKRPGNFTQTTGVRNRAMALMEFSKCSKAADTATSDKSPVHSLARSLAVISKAYAVHVECQGAQEQAYSTSSSGRVQSTTMGHIVNALDCKISAVFGFAPCWVSAYALSTNLAYPPAEANTYTTRCIL